LLQFVGSNPTFSKCVLKILKPTVILQRTYFLWVRRILRRAKRKRRPEVARSIVNDNFALAKYRVNDCGVWSNNPIQSHYSPHNKNKHPFGCVFYWCGRDENPTQTESVWVRREWAEGGGFFFGVSKSLRKEKPQTRLMRTGQDSLVSLYTISHKRAK